MKCVEFAVEQVTVGVREWTGMRSEPYIRMNFNTCTTTSSWKGALSEMNGGRRLISDLVGSSIMIGV